MAKKYLSILLSFFIVFFCIYSLEAAESLQTSQGIFNIGQNGWEIHPYIGYSQYYSSNVSLNPSGEQDPDYIFTGRTGISIFSPDTKLGKEALIENRANIFYFNGYADWVLFKNHDKKGIRPSLETGYDYFSGTGFGLKLYDKLIVIDQPPDNELTGLALNIENHSNIDIKYGTRHWATSVGYKNIVLEYAELDDYDRMTHIAEWVGYYILSPKTEFFAKYNFGRILYDKETADHRNAIYNKGLGGLNWKITPKIVLNIEGGYQQRDYDSGNNIDFKGWIGNLKLNWRPILRKTLLKLEIKKDITQSTYATNSYYDIYGGNIKFTHKFSNRWNLSLNGFLYWDKYPTPTTENGITKKRDEMIWQISTDIDYYIYRGVSIGAGYTHRERNSNFNNFDYKENRINIAKIQAMF